MTAQQHILNPRYEMNLHEDLITPMHHHDDTKDFFVATDPTTGVMRDVTVAEATHLAEVESAKTPRVDRTDQINRGLTRSFGRRGLFRAGGIGVGALAAASFAPKMSFAAGSDGDLLVTVFLRGGMDGLSAVIPVNDPNYYKARPTIGVKAERTFALNSDFGMNKDFGALKPLWDAKQMAVVVGSGNPGIRRSHFEDQTVCESAAPANMRSGWLARHVQYSSSAEGTFRIISMGTEAAMSVTSTAFDTLSIGAIDSFLLESYNFEAMRPTTQRAIERMFATASGKAQSQTALTFQSIDRLKTLRETSYAPSNGAVYPDNPFGSNLRDVARMAKAGVGLEVATVDLDNWDMHNNMGSDGLSSGWFSERAKLFSSGLAAFAADLGPLWNKTTVVVMSEFGRRVAQTGSAAGTDHGHGNVLWVLGGNVNGGVYGTQPLLTTANMTLGDVPITTDYRRVLSEVVAKRLKNSKLDAVFPGFQQQTPLNIVRS